MVTAHENHVVGFSIIVVFQVSSLGRDVVSLLLNTLRRSAGRLFPRYLSVHSVECCEALYHQQTFHSVTCFVFSVECVFANTCTYGAATKSQFSIEVSSKNRYVFCAVCRVLLDRSVHFSNVVVRISRVGEVHTHQFDALVVYRDRGSEGPFIDVFSINKFVPPLPVQHNSNTVFVIIFFKNLQERFFSAEPCMHEVGPSSLCATNCSERKEVMWQSFKSGAFRIWCGKGADHGWRVFGIRITGL